MKRNMTKKLLLGTVALMAGVGLASAQACATFPAARTIAVPHPVRRARCMARAKRARHAARRRARATWIAARLSGVRPIRMPPRARQKQTVHDRTRRVR